MRWSRQIGSARNKSDGNKTRDGEERREGRRKKRVTDSGYYLPPPSSVIIKAALSPPPYINTIPPPPGTRGGKRAFHENAGRASESKSLRQSHKNKVGFSAALSQVSRRTENSTRLALGAGENKR